MKACKWTAIHFTARFLLLLLSRHCFQTVFSNIFYSLKRISQPEDLDIDVLFSLSQAQHTHLDERNGVCTGFFNETSIISPYEKARTSPISATIEGMEESNTMETAFFTSATNFKERVEFFDPAKSRKVFYHSITSRCFRPTSYEASFNVLP